MLGCAAEGETMLGCATGGATIMGLLAGGGVMGDFGCSDAGASIARWTGMGEVTGVGDADAFADFTSGIGGAFVPMYSGINSICPRGSKVSSSTSWNFRRFRWCWKKCEHDAVTPSVINEVHQVCGRSCIVNIPSRNRPS